MADSGNAPGPLSRLILDAQGPGNSYDTMAERAVDPDTGDQLISRGFLYKIARGTASRAPTADEVRGIAYATRTPLHIAQQKAAEQYFGYVATELSGYDSDMRHMVGHLQSMSKTDLLRWKAMMEAEDEVTRNGRRNGH